MVTFNLRSTDPIEKIYSSGLLPQRNQRGLFYHSTSCRSKLEDFTLSSENRRIIRKTDQFTFTRLPLHTFTLTVDTLKEIHLWLTSAAWDFPTASVKTVFNDHIFNELYIWSEGPKIIGYAICLLTPQISHIAYVFYNPAYQRLNLPIRMVLQFIIDSQTQGLKYCYLGQYSEDNGFYKRTMPGFEYFSDGKWITFSKNK